MYVCIYRFQNVFLRCPTPRLHCFLSSHWPSFRFLSFMASFIPSIQFFFGLPRALFFFRHPLQCYFGQSLFCLSLNMAIKFKLSFDSYKMTSHFIVTLKITSKHVKLTCGHANGCDGIWCRVLWQKFTRIFREKFSRRLQILLKRLLAECIASRCIFLYIPCITRTSGGDVMCAALSCFTPETTGGISTNFGTGVKFRLCQDLSDTWCLHSVNGAART